MKEWEEELYWYQLSPAPPRENDLQNYIDRYLAEKDKKHFDWFLHYYERTVNEKAMAVETRNQSGVKTKKPRPKRRKSAIGRGFAMLKNRHIRFIRRIHLKFEMTISFAILFG